MGSMMLRFISVVQKALEPLLLLKPKVFRTQYLKIDVLMRSLIPSKDRSRRGLPRSLSQFGLKPSG